MLSISYFTSGKLLLTDQLVFTAIVDTYEVSHSIHGNAVAFRPQWYLGCLISIEILIAGAMAFSSLTTGSFFVMGMPVPTALSWMFLISAVLHLTTMSFACREEDLRRREGKLQRNSQKELA
jgi:hypothetical protein